MEEEYKNPFEDDNNPFVEEEKSLTETMTDIWDDAVIEIDGVPVTTSLKIAAIFGKDHKKVLRSIRQEEQSYKSNRAIFGPIKDSPFVPTKYIDNRNREQSMYYLTEIGFSKIVMGFTGSKADEWQWKYIAKFEEMRNKLKQSQQISVKTDPQVSRAILMLTERLISGEQKIDSHEIQISTLNDKVRTLEDRVEEISQPKKEVNPADSIVELKNYILDNYKEKKVSGILIRDHQDAYGVIYGFFKKFGVNPYQLRDDLKAKKISEGVPRSEVATYSTITAIKYNPEVWPKISELTKKLWQFAKKG